jgi:hypothetical protein
MYSASGVAQINSSAGFCVFNNEAGNSMNGDYEFNVQAGNIVTGKSITGSRGGAIAFNTISTGLITLAGPVDGLRHTYVGGTQAHDAGSLTLQFWN